VRGVFVRYKGYRAGVAGVGTGIEKGWNQVFVDICMDTSARRIENKDNIAELFENDAPDMKETDQYQKKPTPQTPSHRHPVVNHTLRRSSSFITVEAIISVLLNYATTTAFLFVKRGQSRSRRGFENIVDTIASQTGALEVLLRTNLDLHVITRFRSSEPEALLPHLFRRDRIISKVLLQTD